MRSDETLAIPSEPVEIKIRTLEDMKRLGFEFSNIRYDNLALWYGNSIPSYLWRTCGWGNILKNQDYTWQKFLKKMKYRTEDALLWIKGGITWEDFVKNVVESL